MYKLLINLPSVQSSQWNLRNRYISQLLNTFEIQICLEILLSGTNECSIVLQFHFEATNTITQWKWQFRSHSITWVKIKVDGNYKKSRVEITLFPVKWFVIPCIQLIVLAPTKLKDKSQARKVRCEWPVWINYCNCV
jgi:hypothetical protein